MTNYFVASGKYDRAHRELREQLLPRSYYTPCHHCGGLMIPGQALDLDHTDDRRGYRGMAHAACNRSAGATLGNRRRAQEATPPRQHW